MDYPSKSVTIYRSPAHGDCTERLIVLHMASIPAQIADTGGDFSILVDTTHADAAARELARYEEENRGWSPDITASPQISSGRIGAGVYVVVLLAVHLLQQHRAFALDWWAAGLANAGLIIQGEWWRTITALCLHADATHLLGNLVMGGLFGLLASRRFGCGLAWCGVVLSGVLGNALNAVVQPATHSSVGASTAVFGALGILAAHAWRTKSSQGEKAVYRWAPVVSGVLILSLFGTAGERTDVVAHVTGFGAGLLTGALFGSLRSTWLHRQRVQLLLGTACLGLLSAAWILALVS